MVDSIRPFVALIRTLSRKKVDAPDSGTEPSTVGDAASSGTTSAADRNSQLESRLRARLAAVGDDPERARRTFVETVLLSQLGDELARDPAFADVVARVSDQLQTDSQTKAQLTKLIASLRA